MMVLLRLMTTSAFRRSVTFPRGPSTRTEPHCPVWGCRGLLRHLSSSTVDRGRGSIDVFIDYLRRGDSEGRYHEILKEPKIPKELFLSSSSSSSSPSSLSLDDTDQVLCKALEACKEDVEAFGLSSHQLCQTMVERLAKRLEDDSITPQQLVTLHLFLFQGGPWEDAQLYRYLDPTCLIRKCEQLIRNDSLNNAELLIVLAGQRKIEGLQLSQPDFREALYDRLMRTATNMAIREEELCNVLMKQVIVALKAGKVSRRDPPLLITQTLQHFVGLIDYLDLHTAIDVMTLGQDRVIHVPSLTRRVLSRMRDERHLISLRELLNALHFLVRIRTLERENPNEPFEFDEMFDMLLQEMLIIVAEDDGSASTHDAVDVVQCLRFLCVVDKCHHESVTKILKAMDSIEDHYLTTLSSQNEISNDLSSKNSSIMHAHFVPLARRLSLYLMQQFFPVSFDRLIRQEDDVIPDVEFVGFEDMKKGDMASVIRLVRNVGFLDACYAIDFEKEHRKVVRRPRIGMEMRRLGQAMMPKSEHGESMTSIRRWRPIRKLCEEMENFMGFDDYVIVTHVLPHFSHPMLVVGHLGGNIITIPSVLSNAHPGALKKAPFPGSWYIVEDQNTQSDPDFRVYREMKRRHLRRMGYKLVFRDELVHSNFVDFFSLLISDRLKVLN